MDYLEKRNLIQTGSRIDFPLSAAAKSIFQKHGFTAADE